MSYELKFKRYDSATINSLVGLNGEIFIDTTKKTLVVQDGATTGGSVLATEAYVDAQLTTSTLRLNTLTASTITVTSVATLNSGVVITYEPATSTGAAIQVTAKNSQGGANYADFLKVTNSAAGASRNIKSFRLTSTGDIEVINAAYTTALATLTDTGNFSTYGSINPGAWIAGQVIKDTMLDNSQITVVSTTIAPSGTNTNFITYNYTPVSAQSYLIIHVHISRYEPQGTTDDSWYSVLQVDGAEISYGYQMVNDNGTGTSGRSGVLFPLTGRYTNSSTASKQIQVAARRDTADDSIIIDNSATAIWLRITEIAR